MNLIVSSSPHIRSKIRTQTIMRDVLIALLPALLAGIWVHGLRALLVTLTAAAAAVLAEGLFCMITKRNSTVSNLSSAVTGILLAMTLPARTLLGSGPWKYLCDCGCERHERRYR